MSDILYHSKLNIAGFQMLVGQIKTVEDFTTVSRNLWSWLIKKTTGRIIIKGVHYFGICCYISSRWILGWSRMITIPPFSVLRIFKKSVSTTIHYSFYYQISIFRSRESQRCTSMGLIGLSWVTWRRVYDVGGPKTPRWFQEHRWRCVHKYQ